MAFLNDNVYDNGLSWAISNGSRLDITSAEATTYTEATSTLSLGNKTGLTLTGPANGPTDGREATIPAISDGSVTADGTATHWALTDGVGTLVATGSLTPTQGVSNGNTFTTDAIDLRLRDATAV